MIADLSFFDPCGLKSGQKSGGWGAALALLLGFAIGSPSLAQQSCGDRDALTENLQRKYGELQTGLGIAGGHVLYELWTSDETGSWTLLRTTPDGISCVIATGQDWFGSVPRLHGEPASLDAPAQGAISDPGLAHRVSRGGVSSSLPCRAQAICSGVPT